jgi:hypothetical protein
MFCYFSALYMQNHLKFGRLFVPQIATNIGSANHKFASCHICGRSGFLKKFVRPQIFILYLFADRPPLLRTKDIVGLSLVLPGPLFTKVIIFIGKVFTLIFTFAIGTIGGGGGGRGENVQTIFDYIAAESIVLALRSPNFRNFRYYTQNAYF